MRLKPDDFEMTPLAAYGLIAIGCVLAFLGLEKFSRAEAALKRDVISAQTELATLTAIRDTDYWADRLGQSTQARQQLQTALWRGQTSGVIAAELQQALRQLASAHNFNKIQVRVDPDPAEIDGISVLSFEFTGWAPSAKTLADFFEGIAVNPKIIILDEVDFAQSLRDRRPPRLSLSGLIPVQIVSSQAGGG